jgi:hypothetical protein
VIRHVVLWRLSGGSSEEKKSQFEALAPVLKNLTGHIPGLLSLTVSLSTGPNPKNWDMCLISDHESWEALDVYANHPLHLDVAKQVSANTLERSGADFEV